MPLSAVRNGWLWDGIWRTGNPSMRIIVELLLLIVWLGLLLSTGYVTAPVLFAHLPKVIAGQLAGTLFHIVSYAGMVCAAGLFVLGIQQEKQAFLRSTRCWFLVMALLGVLLGEFLITPVIVALKTHGNHALLSLVGGGFGVWHSVSATGYLLITLSVLTFAVLWAKKRQIR